MNAPIETLKDIYTQAVSETADVRALGAALGEVQGLSETVLRYTRLFYGRLASNVTDAVRAAVILGPRVVGHIAVQHQLVCGLDVASLPDGVAQRLWAGWIQRGLAARFLAERTRTVHPDLAFTAGLALEYGVGPMLARQGQHLRWLAQVRTLSGDRRIDAERELFGETNVDVFQRLARRWGLPAWLPAIVRLHRLPIAPDTPEETAALQRICAWAATVGEAITSPAAGPALEDAVREAVAMGVHPDDGWQILQKVLRWTSRAAEALDVDVTPQPSLEDLRSRTGDYKTLQGDGDWAGIVQAENDRLREQLAEVRAALARAQRQDPVTGLPNHMTFLELAGDALDEARAQDLGATLLLVDLDDFVTLNGRYGHLVGDRLLELVARRLRGVTRADNVLGRVGPDAFAILVPGDARTGQVVAERARAAIEAMHLDTGGRRVVSTATVFGQTWDRIGPEDTPSSMLTRVFVLRKSPAAKSRNRTVWKE